MARRMTSSAAPRIVLLLAVLCAAGGLLLKLSDVRDRHAAAVAPQPAPVRSGGGPAPVIRDEDAAAPAGDTRASADDDGGSAGTEPGRAPAAGGAPRAAGPSHAAGPGTFGWVDDAPRAQGMGSTGRRLARQVARERRRAGLDVAEAGDGGAAGLGAHGGTPTAAGVPAGAAPGAPGATPPSPASEQAPQVGFASAEGTQYPTDEHVEVPVGKLSGQAGTMSFWLQPSWAEGNKDDASFLGLGNGALEVFKNVDFLRFEFTDQSGTRAGLGAPIDAWKAGEWHQVTTTWSGNRFSLYVDGQLVSQTTINGGVQLPPDATLGIGSAFNEGRPVAPGVIGTVDVQPRPWTPAEVQRSHEAATGAQPPKPGGARTAAAR